MFQLNSQIPNVMDFKFSKYGQVLVIGKYPAFNLNINGELINTFTIDNPDPLFVEFGDSIYYSDFNGKAYEINLSNRSKRLINNDDKYISFHGHLGTDFLIGTKTSEGVDHAEIIDSVTLESRYKIESLIGHRLFAAHLYYTSFDDYSKIFCLSTDTYKQLWEFDVSVIGRWTNSKGEHLNGEIVSIIGVWNDLLLLHVTHNKVLAINSAGAIEWEIENFILPEEQRFFPHGERSDIRMTVNWLLNSQKGKLYLLGSHYLFEFDLESRQRTILKDFSADMAWLFKAGELHENYILFSGYKHMTGYPDHIGIIDLLQNEVIWEYKTESNAFFKGHPVMHEDRLYIKNFKNLLLEFKKD